MSDPNDYGAAAGYVLNEQGNYVNNDYSSSVDVSGNSNIPYTAPDVTFDAQSFSSQPEDYNFGSVAVIDVGSQNPIGNINDWSWDYAPVEEYSPSVLTSNLDNFSDGYSDWGVNNVDTSPQNWWDQAGGNIGNWWNQTSGDVTNWFGQYGGGNVTGTLEAPISQSFADSPWSQWVKDWSGGTGSTSMETSQNLMEKVREEGRVESAGEAGWAERLTGLDRNLEPSTRVDNIWFQDTGNGNFTTPWNPKGEDKKWIEETPGGLVFTPLIAFGKALGLPTQGETAGSSGLGEPVYADMIPSSFGKNATVSPPPEGGVFSKTATGGLTTGDPTIGGWIRSGDQTFFVDQIERDPKTNEIVSIRIANQKFPDQPLVVRGGDVLQTAIAIDHQYAPKTPITIGTTPTVVPPSTTPPPIQGIPGNPGSSTKGLTPLTGRTQEEIQSWGQAESAYTKGYTDFLKTVDNTFVVDYSTGKIVGVKDYDPVTGQPRDILYSDKTLSKEDKQLIKQTQGWVQGFNNGMENIDMTKVGSVDMGQSLRKALEGGRGGGDSSPYYNTYTGQPTALGAAIGLQQDIQLQASAQNNPSYGIGGSNENAGWIRVGNYSVYTQDPNTMSREVQEAIQLTESEHPGFMKAIREGGGWNHQTGAPFAPGSNDMRIPTQFLYSSEIASADTNAEALFGTRIYGGTFTPGGGFKSVLPLKDFQFLSGAGGGYSKQNYLPSEWTRANFSGNKEVNTGEWQDYRTMIQQGEGLKYGQTPTGEILTGAAADQRKAMIIATGNKLAQEEGDSKMFAVLSSLNTGISVGPKGQNTLTTEMINKAQLGARNNESIYEGLTGGAGRFVDSMVRNPTPVDVDPDTGKVEFVPWTWGRYFTPSGVVENTSDKYIPVEVQGWKQHQYESPFTGQIVAPSVTSAYGSKQTADYNVLRQVGLFGNLINNLGEGTNTGPLNFAVFQRPANYSMIFGVPSSSVTPSTAQTLPPRSASATAEPTYVAPTYVAPTVVAPGSNYLQMMFPGWGKCSNGSCLVVPVQRHIKKKTISQSRKKVSC